MKFFKLIIVAALLLSSCKKDDPPAPNPGEVEKLDNGMLVLCEGLFQHNNSSVSWVELPGGGTVANFFEIKTMRSLGDTGNDMKQYGGKIYTVVNVSSTIEVLNASDFTPIKQIEMIHNGQPKQPRSLAFANGNVYVTCFDGHVDVIDTNSLTVTERIGVGANPEGLAVANNKLYVANSGGLNFPNVDSTVSVIDLNTNVELQKITVGKNPGAVLSNDAGDVFVIARGDHGAIPSRLRKIDSGNDQLVNSNYTFDISGMAQKSSNEMLVYDETGIRRFNYQADAVDYTYPINMSEITTIYGVFYHPTEDNFYVLDAMGYTNTGYVRKFSSNGSLVSSYQVGLNPAKILFFD